ncbi:hypothetical protein FRACYDRAFT_268262 [Fragilariopsis cylindrus CCMP1102]|uniref:Uncharacterized protein n=1 Tax=Fragilariopsis cylindrus CCMP1102 TaxID=635003 RepID=A0A1E7FJF7_9STRA|nr:hypothetical protein FRACYDRAFT_268262 [Fragilariopsis cylindrus CCMP1102]|eukprot:OEU18311.1 hypothetical protein FRACYDRAFT_268262 [Fragilariopsis cylindrus CCMP1102]
MSIVVSPAIQTLAYRDNVIDTIMEKTMRLHHQLSVILYTILCKKKTVVGNKTKGVVL